MSIEEYQSAIIAAVREMMAAGAVTSVSTGTVATGTDASSVADFQLADFQLADFQLAPSVRAKPAQQALARQLSRVVLTSRGLYSPLCAYYLATRGEHLDGVLSFGGDLAPGEHPVVKQSEMPRTTRRRADDDCDTTNTSGAADNTGCADGNTISGSAGGGVIPDRIISGSVDVSRVDLSGHNDLLDRLVISELRVGYNRERGVFTLYGWGRFPQWGARVSGSASQTTVTFRDLWSGREVSLCYDSRRAAGRHMYELKARGANEFIQINGYAEDETPISEKLHVAQVLGAIHAAHAQLQQA